MLRALGPKSIRLITNNPLKLEGLRRHGIKVSGRMPSLANPNRHNIRYLRTKKVRAGHWINVADAPPAIVPPAHSDVTGAAEAGSAGRTAASD
jgi:hypothetical protein